MSIFLGDIALDGIHFRAHRSERSEPGSASGSEGVWIALSAPRPWATSSPLNTARRRPAPWPFDARRVQRQSFGNFLAVGRLICHSDEHEHHR